MPERKTIRVAAAVIYENGRVFATARGYGKYKGWWEFPGGKIENGETPREALVREIKEELTAEISVGNLIKTVEYDYPDFHLSMDCFWSEIVSGELILKEADDARWLTADHLDEVKWLPADLELIGLIKKTLHSTIDGTFIRQQKVSILPGGAAVKLSLPPFGQNVPVARFE